MRQPVLIAQPNYQQRAHPSPRVQRITTLWRVLCQPQATQTRCITRAISNTTPVIRARKLQHVAVVLTGGTPAKRLAVKPLQRIRTQQAAHNLRPHRVKQTHSGTK